MIVTQTEDEALKAMEIASAVPGAQHASWINECEVEVQVKAEWTELMKVSLKEITGNIRER